jgi:hypothetical protein
VIECASWPGSVIGLTRRPLKAETTGSIPVRATKSDGVTQMKTSAYQKLRGRAENRGLNVKLARELRKAAAMLEEQGNGSF